jgi:eukaryotic-like serine/threonine-protein kinase
MRPQDPFIGRAILNGRFQILQKIGSGGMGAVYKALEPDTNRLFGVKILHPKLANRKDLVSRFRREARALRQLTHPNTVKVFEYGELDDGALYIVMEFLEGKNLNQTVRAEGPFDAERALPILVQVCGALDEAHRAGIVHRDLKPENIFLVQSGTLRDFPKVLDFGLAKVGEQHMQPGSVVLTQKGMVFGTPEFMSPEQAQGKVLTSASDIYSLAVILYEVLTGKLPFQAGATLDYIHLHVTAPPVLLNQRVAGRTFPPPLESIIARALAKRPEERFGSASEFATALQSVLDGTAQVSTPAAGAWSPSATAGLPPHEQPPDAFGGASTVRRAGRRPRVRIAQRQPGPGGGPDPDTRRAVTQPNVPQLVLVAVAFLAIGVALAFALTKYVIR